MNVDKAAEATYNLAVTLKSSWDYHPAPEMSFEHLENMWSRWDISMSETKKCRWLGWMQGAMVAMLYPSVSLETMKDINKRFAKDVSART